MNTNNSQPTNHNPEKNSKDYFLLDVRTQQEFNEAHIPNSINIPMNEIPANLEKLSKINIPILLICRSGSRAHTVQDFLTQNKIINTKVLEGGILKHGIGPQ